jgi:hypothetical protein
MSNKTAVLAGYRKKWAAAAADLAKAQGVAREAFAGIRGEMKSGGFSRTDIAGVKLAVRRGVRRVILSASERVLIWRHRLDTELASHTGKGALPRDKVLDVACKLFAAFDADQSLARIPTAALLVELKQRKAAAEIEATQ